MEKSDANKRVYYLDVMRTVACFLVILLHTSAYYLLDKFGSLDFWIGDCVNGLTRVAVPLFVMISGALLLNEDYQYTFEKMKRHIKRMVIFFVFWSSLYCFVFHVLSPVAKHTPVSVKEVLSALITGHYHLWYVYLIIGIYLIIPILRLWVKKENLVYVRYFLLISFALCFFVCQVITVIGYYFEDFTALQTVYASINLQYVGGYTAYLLLGWYLSEFEVRNKKRLYILGGIGAAISIVGTGLLSITLNDVVQLFENTSINVLAASVATFVFIKDKCSEKKYNLTLSRRLVSFVSSRSLGIYAVHAGLVSVFHLILQKVLPDFAIIQICVGFVISSVLSLMIVFALSRIKPFKKYLV